MDDFKITFIIGTNPLFFMKEMHVVPKETTERSRPTSHSPQGEQILKYCHAKNRCHKMILLKKMLLQCQQKSQVYAKDLWASVHEMHPGFLSDSTTYKLLDNYSYKKVPLLYLWVF